MLSHSFVLLVPAQLPILDYVTPLYADDFHVLCPWLPRTCCMCHTWVRVRVWVMVRDRVWVKVRVRLNSVGVGIGFGVGF